MRTIAIEVGVNRLNATSHREFVVASCDWHNRSGIKKELTFEVSSDSMFASED